MREEEVGGIRGWFEGRDDVGGDDGFCVGRRRGWSLVGEMKEMMEMMVVVEKMMMKEIRWW